MQVQGSDAIVILKKGIFNYVQSKSECPTPLNSFVKIAISLSREKARSHVFQGFQCCSSNCITCCASQTLSRDVPSILCTHRGHKMTPWTLRICQFLSDSLSNSTNIFSKSILLPVRIPHCVHVTCQCLF